MAAKSPRAESDHGHLTPDRVAAFAFGVVFIGVMLIVAIFYPQPTRFQEFTFRLILALAAAGIGAILPGLIVANVGKFVRAGGAAAFFVIVFWFNPPELVATGTSKVDQYLSTGHTFLAANNFHSAQDYYDRARKVAPQNPEPHFHLGRVEFKRARYDIALRHFQSAFDLGKESNGAHAYELYRAYEAVENYGAALKTLEKAEALYSDNDEMRLTIVYDIGLMSLLMWLKTDAPHDSNHYRTALSRFNSFLQSRGFPPHWARYHLACIRAQRALDSALQRAEANQLLDEARRTLATARQELAEYKSEKAKPQREMMEALLSEPSKWQRSAGNPIACPPLAQIVTS